MAIKLKYYLSPYAITRVNWMAENHPNQLNELYKTNKLKSYLTRIAQEAYNLHEQLEKRGMREDEAQEIVHAQIIAPEMDNPTENPPIPRSALLHIMESLSL